MKRSLFGAVALAAVAVTAVLIGTASAAKPPAPTNSSCPGSTKNLLVADNVGADSTTAANTVTYTFDSFVDQSPVNGVPGLVKYCVYDTSVPTSVVPLAAGADGSDWTAAKSAKSFSFSRAGGEKTNIPLDGTSTEIGTATFGTLPTTQTIVLHISDSAKCAALYGGTSPTCFVLPGEKPEPVCDAGSGNEDAAYNTIPTDVGDCSPPSLGFQATRTNEFGDEVVLNTTTGNIKSLTVDFQSFACTNGQWLKGVTDPCQTTSGATFDHPITANIYEKSDGAVPGALLGTVTQTFTIPLRPSADPANCPAGGNGSDREDGSQWFNPTFGTCQFSISKLLTFTFAGSGIPVPSDGQVIWTVAFNTESAGSTPLGVDGPYNSLNVGAMTYPNSPYAGDDFSTAAIWNSNVYTSGLDVSPGWDDNRPLGMIVVGA